jgi:hypothetical protein
MANKPAPRNWNDIQIMIATGSMALTLAFWNVFAGPDRDAAIKHAQEQAALPPPQPMQTSAPVVESQPILQESTLPNAGPILLGGSAPQTQIIVKTGGGGGGGAAAAGGSGAAASTGSS